MELKAKILNRLRMRGFSEDMLLNNRGLIDAVMEDTILEVTFNDFQKRAGPNRFSFANHETKKY